MLESTGSHETGVEWRVPEMRRVTAIVLCLGRGILKKVNSITAIAVFSQGHKNLATILTFSLTCAVSVSPLSP